MKKTLLGLALAGMTFASSGCAGIFMTAAAPQPFGGIQADAAVISGKTLFGGAPQVSAAGVILGGLDFPLSLTVDTLALPYTIPVWAKKG